MLAIFEVTPILSVFGVTPIPGPIIILPDIMSGSVPKSLLIQGFVPDVVVGRKRGHNEVRIVA